MKKYIISISLFLLIFPLRTIGQENIECEQFNKAFEYIEASFQQKETNYKKLQIDTIVQQWSGIPLMIPEYYAYKMGIRKTEFQKLDTATRNEIFRKNQEDLMRIHSSYSIACFNSVQYKRPNHRLSFIRISDESIGVWIVRIKKNRKKHTNGKYFIFIFNNKNQIEKVIETTWTE